MIACQDTFEWRNMFFCLPQTNYSKCLLSFLWFTSTWLSLVIIFLPSGLKALVDFVWYSGQWLTYSNCGWFLFLLVCWSRSPERACIWWEERWRKGGWRRRGRIRWAVYSSIAEHFWSYHSNCCGHSDRTETSLYSRPCLLHK